MKRIVTLIALVTVFLVALAACTSAKESATDFTAETYEHGTFTLSEQTGPVVVNFWFPSCPPCEAELPALEASYQHFKDQGVQFVGIQQLGLDTEADGMFSLRTLGVTYPNLADYNATIQLAYSVFAYPSTVFINSRGEINRIWSGPIGETELNMEIGRLLNG